MAHGRLQPLNPTEAPLSEVDTSQDEAFAKLIQPTNGDEKRKHWLSCRQLGTDYCNTSRRCEYRTYYQACAPKGLSKDDMNEFLVITNPAVVGLSMKIDKMLAREHLDHSSMKSLLGIREDEPLNKTTLVNKLKEAVDKDVKEMTFMDRNPVFKRLWDSAVNFAAAVMGVEIFGTGIGSAMVAHGSSPTLSIIRGILLGIITTLKKIPVFSVLSSTVMVASMVGLSWVLLLLALLVIAWLLWGRMSKSKRKQNHVKELARRVDEVLKSNERITSKLKGKIGSIISTVTNSALNFINIETAKSYER